MLELNERISLELEDGTKIIGEAWRVISIAEDMARSDYKSEYQFIGRSEEDDINEKVKNFSRKLWKGEDIKYGIVWPSGQIGFSSYKIRKEDP